MLFVIKFRGDEDFRLHAVAVKVFENLLDGDDTHAVGELNGVAQDLAVANGLLADELAIERDDLDLVGLAGGFPERPMPPSAEGSLIAKIAARFGFAWIDVPRRLVAPVQRAAAVDCSDYRDLVAGLCIVGIKDLVESLDCATDRTPSEDNARFRPCRPFAPAA